MIASEFMSGEVADQTRDLPCRICSGVYIDDGISAAGRGAHRYCAGCGKGYIKTAIRDGPDCLSLRCPNPSCVGLNMIKSLDPDQDHEQYPQYFLRSSVKRNCTTYCEFAQDYLGRSLHNFCWNCGEESHYPVDCKTATEWLRMESDNTKSIEWVRDEAMPLLERYMECYQMSTSNNMLKKKAIEHLRRLQGSGKLEELKEKLVNFGDLSFMGEVWVAIIEYRRILQWTYVHAYYFLEGEENDYLEYLQELAEWAVEKLQQCAELEGNTYFNGEGWREEGFIEYYCKLAEMARLTANYFDNLVHAVERMHYIGSADPDGRKERTGEAGRSLGSRKQKGKDEWTCNYCDFVNSGSVVVCHYCFMWSCKLCTYWNPCSTTRCLMCSDEDTDD